jgi:hypothetical protein
MLFLISIANDCLQLKGKILKGVQQATNNDTAITPGMNDLFNTRRRGVIYDTETFYQDSYRRWNVRNFRITFSYKFGKADLSLLDCNNRGG